MRKTRKFMAIALVISAMLMPFLYFADFAWERAIHRIEMWEKLQHGKMQTIRIETAGLHWMNSGRELLVNGFYFDVYNIRFENSCAIVTGFFDEREREMHFAFAQNQKPVETDGSGSSLIAYWLQKEWHDTIWQLDFSLHQLSVTTSHSYYFHRLSERIVAALEHPPQRLA